MNKSESEIILNTQVGTHIQLTKVTQQLDKGILPTTGCRYLNENSFKKELKGVLQHLTAHIFVKKEHSGLLIEVIKLLDAAMCYSIVQLEEDL